LRVAVSHPSHKNKDVARWGTQRGRMGHLVRRVGTHDVGDKRAEEGATLTKESIRVLVVEDHTWCARGWLRYSTWRRVGVVGEAADGVEAIAQFRKHQPDITLMDLRLPRMSGVDVIQRIRMESPQARVVVLTTYDGDEDIFRALQAGARAYLLKGMTSEELIATFGRFMRAGRIFRGDRQKLAERMGTEELTPREFDVLEQIVHARATKRSPRSWRSARPQ